MKGSRILDFDKLREICGDYQHLNYAKGNNALRLIGVIHMTDMMGFYRRRGASIILCTSNGPGRSRPRVLGCRSSRQR